MGKSARQESTALVYLAAFVIVVIWGCTFVQTKVLINAGLRPDEIFTLRFVIAYLLMLPFSPRKFFMRSFRDEFTALLLGLFGGSIYFIVENYALAYGYCSNVSLIVCLTPLVTALMVGWRYPSERLGKSGVMGSVMALVGMALVVFNGNFVLRLSPLGDILALSACVCWALYSLFIKHLGARYSNMLITRKVFGYGLLTILPLLYMRGVNFDIVFGGGVQVWGNILFLGCVASMLCFLGWNWCLARLGTVRATNFIYLNPVIAIISSAIVLDERVTWIAVLGATLILLGLIHIDRNRKR
ncbi:MAG: DMT family transporter [Bacteroidaceae bacterium]|nr:DMT family transporter [Bacteroidaceae bacterium]